VPLIRVRLVLVILVRASRVLIHATLFLVTLILIRYSLGPGMIFLLLCVVVVTSNSTTPMQTSTSTPIFCDLDLNLATHQGA
jgi:hypothetical protein